MKFSVSQTTSWILILGLSVLVVVLALENRKLKSTLSATLEVGNGLKVGDSLPIAHLLSFEGDRQDWDPKGVGSQSLLHIFATTCPSCRESVPVWSGLVESLSNKVIWVAAISLDDTLETEQYMSSVDLRGPVYCAAESRLRVDFKVRYVPMTVLVDRAGLVQRTWVGRLEDHNVTEILEAILDKPNP